MRSIFLRRRIRFPAVQLRNCSSTGTISADDIIVEDASAASHSSASSSQSVGSSSFFRDVADIDTFSRARVMNFLKRTVSAEFQQSSADGSLMKITTKEVRVGADETQYHATIDIPLPGEYGIRAAEGFACNQKDAEQLATMHAEHIIDALGFQIYTLPSMQKRHASSAKRAGRWAPQPEDVRRPPTTEMPPPLRRILSKDETEGGKWDLVTSAAKDVVAPPHTMFSPTLMDPAAVTRIRQLCRNASMSFDQCCRTTSANGMFTTVIRLPAPVDLGAVEAKGQAEDRDTSVVLACMHGELVADAVGIPLFASEGNQRDHAEAARAFGRRVRDRPAIPGDESLPNPLKFVEASTREAPLGEEEAWIAKHLQLSRDTLLHADVDTIDPSAQVHLDAYLASQRNLREDPFVVQRVGRTYRATVILPLPDSYGTRGGVGISLKSADEAKTMAAMHAVDVLHHIGVPVFADATAQQEHEADRLQKGFTVVASKVVSGWNKPVANASPAAFKKVDSEQQKVATKEAVSAKADSRQQQRQKILQAMGNKTGADKADTTQPTQPSRSPASESSSSNEDKFDYKSKRLEDTKDRWSLDADTPDGFIAVVAEGTDSAATATYGHALMSPRQYDGTARQRILRYLSGIGSRWDSVCRRERYRSKREGLLWHRTIIALPLPREFGERIAVGEGSNPAESDNLAAMHAELILDCLGVQMFNDPYQQRRHTHAARLQGRFAPLPEESVVVPPDTPSPPPLRRERQDSMESAKRTASAKKEKTASASKASSNAPPHSSRIDWRSAKCTTIADRDIDNNSKARVQNFLRRMKVSGDVIAVREGEKASQVFVAQLRLALPNPFGFRYAAGIGRSKRDAEALCFMHAERLIDALGIELFNLPGLQTRHAERVKKEGRWAPMPKEAAKDANTPSPEPLTNVGDVVDQAGSTTASAESEAEPPKEPKDVGDVAAWMRYVDNVERFVADQVHAEESSWIAQDKVPRTGIPLYDGALDEAEGQELQPQAKGDLYEYCSRSGLTYPNKWSTRQVGKQTDRKIIATVSVPGFEHVEAAGVGSNKDIAQRRASMHVFALLRRLDPDFSAQESALADGETLQSTKHTAKFKGSFDRQSRQFTTEGKTRALELYAIIFGLDPPRVRHQRRQEGNFITQTTVVELTDIDGRVHSGTASDGGSRHNEGAAYNFLFNRLSRNDSRFNGVLDLLRTHPHLDPEHVVDLTVPPEVEEKITKLLGDHEDRTHSIETLSLPDDGKDPNTQELSQVLSNTADDSLRERRGEILLRRSESKEADPIYIERFRERRNTLSIFAHRGEILDTVKRNPVTILCGTTGCGKTTQVPQYLLDDATQAGNGGGCHIIVTQPRRISAMSIAERIADERRESIGDAVGFAVRFAAKPGQHINFCTSGVLLRMLNDKPNLDGVTHVIIDEIHERDINSDFLLVIIRDLISARPDLRVILMSATLQSKIFSEYFGGAPVINVEGHSFPVKELFLDDLARVCAEQRLPLTPTMKDLSANDPKTTASAADSDKKNNDGNNDEYKTSEVSTETDYEAVAVAVEHVRKSMDLEQSSILVFLPGWDEIVKAKEAVMSRSPSRYFVIQLHSSVSAEEQMLCFKPAPPGKVKLILSTNIAESGVTIDDIAAVIDVGRAKEKSFVLKRGKTTVSRKEKGTVSQLITTYASKANCTQRRGRAGRTREGMVVRLYTRKHLDLIPPFQTPEILRQPLDSLCLQILALNVGDPGDFLAKAIEPPTRENIESAMERLFDLGAVSKQRRLTPLGMRLSKFPVQPRVGKMIILGAMLRCLDSVLTLASTADVDVFVSSREHKSMVRTQREEASLGSLSDQLCGLNAFNMWATHVAEKTPSQVLQLVQDYLLNPQSLMTVSGYKRQFYDILRSNGFLPGSREPPKAPIFVDSSDHSDHASNIGLVKAVLCSSLFPNAAINRGKRLMRNKFDNVVAPSPGSVLHKAAAEDITNPYFVYEEMSRSPEGKVFLRGLTNVSLWAVLLLGAPNGSVDYESELGLGIIDDWIMFKASGELLDTIRNLKSVLDSCITELLVDPSDRTAQTTLGELVGIISDLVNAPVTPNSLVEEPWEERGVISAATPLPPDRYHVNIFQHDLNITNTAALEEAHEADSKDIGENLLDEANAAIIADLEGHEEE